MKPILYLLIAAGALLVSCQQIHPAAQTLPVLEVHH